VETEAERLNALRWHTRYTLAETLLAAGQAGDAITMLGPLTAEDPLREKNVGAVPARSAGCWRRNWASHQAQTYGDCTSRRCPEGGTKDYIGPDASPTAGGIYEITFDTSLVTTGCLELGAVGLDRVHPKTLYPAGGEYIPIKVNNGQTQAR
jgi:hypothetical protein